MSHPRTAPIDLMSMKVNELLARWPTAAQVFIAYRLACIGCEFAGFHTTQQTIEVYGLESDPFVEELRRVIERTGSGNHNSWEEEDET